MIRIMQFKVIFAALALIVCACGVKPKGSFVSTDTPPVPDYARSGSWAALPEKADSADLLPSTQLEDVQDNAQLDVFFLHPTTYTGKKGHKFWNASIADSTLNLRTDETTIKYQASIFNGVGRVFAPRYRQAHLESFYTKKYPEDAQKALDLAYRDIRASFEHYLEEYNNGRPFIIAGHSQGTLHAARLIRDVVEKSDYYDRLVAAYLIGMPVKENYFKRLQPCETPEEVQCFCTWRTVRDGYYPKDFYQPDAGIIVTNPLLWSIRDSSRAPQDLNLGAVMKKFYEGPVPGLVDARIDDGLLMVTKPKLPFPASFLRNYHIADLNFYYMNVRRNAQLRAEAYFRDAP